MAYFLFKCWRERLFCVTREDVLPQKSDLSIELVPITEKNLSLVGPLRGYEFESQFRYQLSLGDSGYYAYHNGAPIGYGWIKHQNSDDYFFKIGEGCVYLCRFFVHESVRGHGVYPEMISRFIENQSNINTFYIAVEKGNESSERGLKKVGFRFVKQYGFIRGFKHTFNKKKLMQKTI